MSGVKWLIENFIETDWMPILHRRSLLVLLKAIQSCINAKMAYFLLLPVPPPLHICSMTSASNLILHTLCTNCAQYFLLLHYREKITSLHRNIKLNPTRNMISRSRAQNAIMYLKWFKGNCVDAKNQNRAYIYSEPKQGKFLHT